MLKLYLDMVKMYLYRENEIPSCSGSKATMQTDRQAGRQTETQLKLLPIHKRGPW